MASTFFGFNVVRSGLTASQMALNTVSHNIANANTEGFSRQRLTTKSDSPDTFPSVPGAIGTGVKMNNVIQIRDEFLDFKFRSETTKNGEYSVLASTYKTLEAVINEPSDSGIRTVMDEFFSSLHELNKAPESLTTRALVRQRAIALTETVKGMSASFKREQVNLDFEIDVIATEINGYARQISDLNRVIYTTELDGVTANDLRDQRNLKIDKLSELVDVDYYDDSAGRFYVDVNGRSLVSHYTYDQLKVVKRTTRSNPYDVDRLSDLEWESGSTFTTKSGKLRALIDMRDNVSGDTKGIPYYVDKLNEFVDVLATELNTVHKNGYTLDNTTGINMFSILGKSTGDYETWVKNKGFDGGPAIDVSSAVLANTSALPDDEKDYMIKTNIKNIIKNNEAYASKSIKYIDGKYLVADRMEAENISISSDVEKDLDLIAASATAAGTPGDGDNALNLAQVRHNVGLFAWGSPDDFVKSLVSNLGVDAQDAIRNQENGDVMLNQINFKRQSIMGVSLDEEMSNMVKFQHSYNACARVMTTLDEMIDLIVNRLGTVGR